MFNRFIVWYNNCLTKSPLLTNAFTGLTTAFAGDVACQYYEQKYLHVESEVLNKQQQDISQSTLITVDTNAKNINTITYNWQRAWEMGFIRAIVIVPFITFYFPWLARICPGTTLPRVMGRVALDQMIGSPTVISLVFFSNACLRGDPMSSFHRMYTQGPNAWLTGAQYWPIIHSINFKFTPVQHQALVAHLASLYWNAVLSFYSNKKSKRVNI